MTVTATDRGTPQQSDSATITINIVRNTQSPVFTNSGQYATTIDQNLNIGTSVFTVTATDGDTVTPYNVITYTAIGDGIATSYFSIDSNSGLITVRDTLTKDNSATYTLRVRATDGGGLTADATVFISINRNIFSPEWLQTSYVQSIAENFALGQTIVNLQARDQDALSLTICCPTLLLETARLCSISKFPVQEQFLFVNLPPRQASPNLQ